MAKKESKTVLDLAKLLHKPVRVKFVGGREVIGNLKGHDHYVNLVLDDAEEFLRDPEDPYRLLDSTRSLGLIVAKGTSVMVVSPKDGMTEIENPFIAPQ
eukprot:GDKH01025586.1.p1 GENE.GDKH01025586.1~~GDKH01025586.1.p1  ORF type:complete len:99 (-),score=16.16 GDKH01025586.1:88-384(-)